MFEELLKKMLTEYSKRISADNALKALRQTIYTGPTSETAVQYAEAAGRILSDILQDNVTAGLFGETIDVSDLASLIIPMLERNHEGVVAASSTIQKVLNKRNKLNLKVVKPEFDRHAAMNIVGKMANYDTFEEAEWMLGEPIVTNSVASADETLKANADFQSDAGVKLKMIRYCEPDACAFCKERAGSYDYEDVKDKGNDAWLRHENCRCVFEIIREY